MKTSRIALFVVLASIIVAAVPASALLNEQTDADRAEKILEIAQRAEERVGDLIDLISLNTTAIDTAGLLDEFNQNVTLFEQGSQNVTNAEECLALDDYNGTIENATEALSIFKEVLTNIQYIMEESGISKGDILDGQGLLTAMERALDRINRLRIILEEYEETSPEEVLEALELLDEATTYLNIDEAKLWLLDGNFTAVAENLTIANGLISDAHQILKDIAKENNLNRIGNYLAQMERIRERFQERYQYHGGNGVDVGSIWESFEYENMEQFMEQIQALTDDAQGNDDIHDVMKDLKEIGKTIRDVDKALQQEVAHGRGNGNQGQGNSGNGSGNGNGNGNGQGGKGN